jgi:hypothetical protein
VRAGQTNVEIADAMGIPEFSVKNICHHRHIKLRGDNQLVFKVQTALYDACGAEADRRHMTISALLRLMLSKIVPGQTLRRDSR